MRICAGIKKMELNQEFEEVEIGKLKAHPRNPRNGNTEAIKESIEHNGFYGAIIAQKSTGYILAGNHRWKAAKEAGALSVPVAWIDVEEEHANRIMLADNRTNDMASYDEAGLAALLTELNESTGLEGTGYLQTDLDLLLAEVTQSSQEYSPKDGKELSLGEFENFDHKCPRCAFEWTEEK